MHNSMVSRALEGLWSNRVRTLTPLTMNEILQAVCRDVIQVERPAEGTGRPTRAAPSLKNEVKGQVPGSKQTKQICRGIKPESRIVAVPIRGQRKVVCPLSQIARTLPQYQM